MVKKNGSHGQEAENFRLGEGTWEAVILAASDVEEMLRQDLKQLRAGAPITETNLSDLMPRRFLPRYDEVFAEPLALASAHLTERLERVHKDGWAYPNATFLNSVAEEMLMSRVIQFSMDAASSADEVDDLETLNEVSFEDRDFEWLYDLSQDGVVDDPDVARFAGFANLSFDDWFKPFRQPVGESPPSDKVR